MIKNNKMGKILEKILPNNEQQDDEKEPWRNLKSIRKIERSKFVFCWNDVPGRDNEQLKNHLVKDRKIEWVKDAEIKKTDDTITITKGKNLAELELWRDKVILSVTGGKTYTYDVKKEDGYLHIYKRELREGLVFWFKFTPILFVIYISLSFFSGIICYYLRDYIYISDSRGCWMLSWLSLSPSIIMRDLLTIFIMVLSSPFILVLIDALRKRYNF